MGAVTAELSALCCCVPGHSVDLGRVLSLDAGAGAPGGAAETGAPGPDDDTGSGVARARAAVVPGRGLPGRAPRCRRMSATAS